MTDSTEVRTLTIEGMNCRQCIAAVADALNALDNMKVENVNMGTARVRGTEANISRERLAEVLQDEGYTLTAIE